jgi:hypothetical protein
LFDGDGLTLGHALFLGTVLTASVSAEEDAAAGLQVCMSRWSEEPASGTES